MFDFEIENELRPNLSPGEKLLWTGKPKQGLMLRSSDAFLIPFSLLWGGFAVFWESSVVASGGPIFFMLWGIPFVLMGIYITVGRFFVDAYKRSKTIYGLTPDRVLIKSGIFSRDVKSINIKTLSDITINQKSDNSGTITLGATDSRYASMQGMNWPGVTQTPMLELGDDVLNVYNKIIELQRQK